MTTYPAKPRKAVVLPTAGRASVKGGVARRSIELQVLPGASVATAAAEAAQASAVESEASAAAALVSQNAAAVSASAALTSENNAETAETNAETAQGLAETAQAAAEAAQSAAESAQGDAETAASTATTQAGIATTQAGLAATSAGNAATAETNAETAETNAEAAQALAEAARDTAQGYATDAQGYATAASGHADDAEAAAASVRWESQGAYSGATAYVANDVVLDQGSSWVALQNTTGNAPPTLPTESNAYWQLVAKQGDPGADGTGSGTVESVALSVPTGLAVSGSPITTTGTLAITYTAGYQGYTSAEAALVASALQADDIGVSIQAYSANLAEWSGINPSANGASLVAAANYAAMRVLLDLEAGTDFLSPSAIAAAYQPLDAQLTAFAANTGVTGKITVSTSDPSGGSDGDLWFKYTA